MCGLSSIFLVVCSDLFQLCPPDASGRLSCDSDMLVSLVDYKGMTQGKSSLPPPFFFQPLTVNQFSSSWPVSKRRLLSPVKFRSYNPPRCGFSLLFPSLNLFPCTWPKYRIGCPNNSSSVSAGLHPPRTAASEIFSFSVRL